MATYRKQGNYSSSGVPRTSEARIGKMPSSARVGTAANALHQYARNYWGQGQIYSYLGPGISHADTSMTSASGASVLVPDYDWDRLPEQRFPVLLSNAPKVDTAHPARRLGGILQPWRAVPYFDEAYGRVTTPSRITWEADCGDLTGEQTLWEAYTNFPENWWNPEQLFNGIGVAAGAEPQTFTLFNFNGPNLAIDGDMQEDNLFWYTPGNNAVLSKNDTVFRPGHTLSLKIAYGTTSLPFAYAPTVGSNARLRQGAEYRVKVWCRGPTVPSLRDGGGTLLATGTSSEDWQFLDSGWFVNGGNHIMLCSAATGGPNAVYFSDLDIRERGRFGYNPDADGGFSVGFIRADRCRVAGLNIWTMPDTRLYDDEARILSEHVRAGEPIRGYETSGRPSIGTLEHLRSYGGELSIDGYHDDLERTTRRCLLQSGHPIGISTESATYENLRGYESFFKVWPRNLQNLDAATGVKAHPAFYASGEGSILLTSTTGADTWEIEVDGEGLYSDIDQSFLVAAGGDQVKIEVKAATGSRMTVHTYSIWEGPYAE